MAVNELLTTGIKPNAMAHFRRFLYPGNYPELRLRPFLLFAKLRADMDMHRGRAKIRYDDHSTCTYTV